MKWFHFILSHSIFISVCAVALCLQTWLLTGHDIHLETCYLVFGCTLSSYNFYWLISKFKFKRNEGFKAFLIKNLSNVVVFCIAAPLTLVILLRNLFLLDHVIVSILLTLLYSIPLWPVKQPGFVRKAGFLKTLLLSFTWTYVSTLFPAALSFFEMTTDIAILFIARFSFMLMLCLIFDSRDISIDKMHAISSLATDVSRRNLQMIFIVAFLVYVSAGVALRYWFGTHAQLISFIVIGIVTWIVYRMSLKPRSYIFYYFIVDGMMLFSFLGTLLASI